MTCAHCDELERFVHIALKFFYAPDECAYSRDDLASMALDALLKVHERPTLPELPKSKHAEDDIAEGSAGDTVEIIKFRSVAPAANGR